MGNMGLRYFHPRGRESCFFKGVRKLDRRDVAGKRFLFPTAAL
jgi:hypothetical protein